MRDKTEPPEGAALSMSGAERVFYAGRLRTQAQIEHHRGLVRRRNARLRRIPGECEAKGCTRPRIHRATGRFESHCDLHKAIRDTLYRAKKMHKKATKRAEEMYA